jgi:DNA-binding CsgD family transcriptional regulator
MTLKNKNNFVFLISILIFLSCSKKQDIELDYSFETAINVKHNVDDFEKINFISNQSLDLGFFKGNVWIKLKIRNNDRYGSHMVVTNDFFNRNYRFYKLDAVSNKLSTLSVVKDLKKNDQRTYNDLKPNFEINLKPNESATFFITTESDGRVIQATPSLIHKEDYVAGVNETTIVNIVFFLAIAMLLLINFFYWRVFRNRIYYFYILYIIASWFFYFNIEGYFNGILTHHIVDHLVFISIRIWILSVGIFSSKFLDLATTNPTFFKFGKRSMIIILGGTTLYQFIFFNSSIANLHLMENIFGFFWMLIAILMIRISLKKIPLQAKYYLISFSFLVFFLIIGLLNSHNAILPGDPFSYFKVGMIIEFSGFTYFISLIIKSNLKKNSILEDELIEQQKELINISKKLKESRDTVPSKNTIEKTDLLSIFKLVESTLSKEGEWPEFKIKFEELNPNFLGKLNESHPNLLKSEIRLLILIRIGFTQKEIANVLNIAPDSVKKAKQRVRKKLDLSSTIILSEYLAKLS